ncbi:hypothetical protein VP1G_02849 [Cytospora mali]|uniref:Heterokaryon incompatibility domain-containing protein n=1 Tax=Cytospora mali TaxID=578113 RepID=A0A194UUK1_CYTMA|nr:hypothetical protein VP1G_02849 [Valsa mali var. pyri (nom. inval.)]
MDDNHDLYERIQCIWESMFWHPINSSLRTSTSIDRVGDRGSEKSSRRNSSSSSDCGITIETESDSDQEELDLFMDCPLWRDLPDNLIESLLECSTKPDNHFELLDAKLSTIMKIRIPLRDKTRPAPFTTAANILERLPKPTTPLSDSLGSVFERNNSLLDGYLIKNPSAQPPERSNPVPSWGGYKVTTLLDSNTIRLALMIAHLNQMPQGLGALMEGYANLLSRLMDSIATHVSHGKTLVPLPQSCDEPHLEAQDIHHSRHIVKAFIWTAWQRALLLYAYYVLGVRLRYEVDPNERPDLGSGKNSKDFDMDFRVLGSSLQANGGFDGPSCEYMCRSAFELLRTSVVACTQDFRSLFARFEKHFGGREPRCRQQNGVWKQCNGKTLSSCGRFFGLDIPDQSAHDMTCAGACKRVLWDEPSYRGVKGPRAVSCLLSSQDGPLQYCVASDRTLAVSHVWSHGQGGNPEHGFNQCLHTRYSTISRELGCDSYWIDAACIPSDPKLRSAAIKTINPIFRDSMITLIIDRDIMEVDVTEPSVEQLEVLVTILLLSDWNVRAWTMLEVIRGSKAVHLLCRDNRVMSLRDVLLTLYKHGKIDLCALLVGSPQLVPTGVELQPPSIESAGVMLSRRYASRSGDDVIIWSLLVGDDRAHSSPEALWRSRVGQHVKTGFLMSSCDRVKGAAGFGWAPATPQFFGRDSSALPLNASVYWPYDGDGTFPARIMVLADRTTVCLRGRWLVHLFSLQDVTFARRQCDFFGSCWERAEQLVTSGKYNRAIFVRPLLSESIESGWMPETSAPFMAAQNLDDSQDMAVAVCATKEDHAQHVDLADPDNWVGPYELEPELWEWKGVFRCPIQGAPDGLDEKVRYVRLV